jgi:hypothetical protein
MTFEELLDQAIDVLRRRGRVTYRALKLQFHLAGRDAEHRRPAARAGGTQYDGAHGRDLSVPWRLLCLSVARNSMCSMVWRWSWRIPIAWPWIMWPCCISPHVIDVWHWPRRRVVGQPRRSHTSMRSRGVLSRRGFWDTITVITLDRRRASLGSQTHVACPPWCGSAPPR